MDMKPNRRMLESLFREMYRAKSLREEAAKAKYEALRQAADDLKAKLLDNKELKRLEKATDAAYEAHRKEATEASKMVSKVRRLYYVRGVCPSVIKAADAMVKQFGE